MSLIKKNVEIKAQQQLVWSILEDFGGVSAWAPYMKHSALIGEQKTGVGTRRKLHHAWGYRIQETVTEWIDGRGFSFDVEHAPWPMKNVRETWNVGYANGHTTVATTVEYAMGLGILGRLLDALLVRYIVSREMRSGLIGLKIHVELSIQDGRRLLQ